LGRKLKFKQGKLYLAAPYSSIAVVACQADLYLLSMFKKHSWIILPGWTGSFLVPGYVSAKFCLAFRRPLGIYLALREEISKKELLK